MTPTQLQIMLALRPGPLSYYDLLAVVDATTATIDKNVQALLDDKQIEEVTLGEVTGLRLVAFRLWGRRRLFRKRPRHFVKCNDYEK